MIPRRFFWLLDALVLWLAYILAYSFVPVLHSWMAPGHIFYLPGLFSILAPVVMGESMPPVKDLSWIYVNMLAAALLVLLSFRDYGRLLVQSRMHIIASSTRASFAGLSLVTLVTFALKNAGWSRLFVVSFTLLSALSLSGYRLLLRRFFLMRQNSGEYARNVLILGQSSGRDWIIRYFETTVSAAEYRLLGQLCLPGELVSNNSLPTLGAVTELGDLLINHPVHEVIAVQPMHDSAWIENVIKSCDYMGVLLRIVPEVLLRDPVKLKTLYPFAELNLPAIVLAPPLWDSDALFIKRVFDMLVSGLLLILLLPLFLLVAIAIKLTTPHLSVFYPWRVVGQNGVKFTGYKFTTMVADADEQKTSLAALNEMTGPVFKIKDDPRVTPLGHFLRKYSINELPQLWSVVKGDMSLVGPRPAGQNELQRYEFWHKRKLSIRPGITCLWQIRGRNKISNFDDWVRMDLEYIDQWSLWLDFRIFVRTIWVVLSGTGS